MEDSKFVGTPKKATTHVNQNEDLIFEKSSPGKKAYRLAELDVPAVDAASLLGEDLAERVRNVSIEIYKKAAAYAEPRGVILADTKFEFGMLREELIWIDEALTPDSSRFWPAALYKPGGPQSSFDKQFVRDYLESIHWPKTPPGPELPAEVVAATRSKYREAYRILYRSDLLLADASVQLGERAARQPELRLFVDFIASSTRGLIR